MACHWPYHSKCLRETGDVDGSVCPARLIDIDQVSVSVQING